jgi:hypothetical protein
MPPVMPHTGDGTRVEADIDSRSFFDRPRQEWVNNADLFFRPGMRMTPAHADMLPGLQATRRDTRDHCDMHRVTVGAIRNART